VYEPEKIVAQRMAKGGVTQYHVKWVGSRWAGGHAGDTGGHAGGQAETGHAGGQGDKRAERH
jgi:hypothetical protein